VVLVGQIVRESLGPQVAAELRNRIVAGELRAGERLIEAELADLYGVSRGPIRDAFKILLAEGLVDDRRQGVVVATIDAGDINDLYSLRGALEGLALRRFMQAGDPQQLGQLKATVDRMEKAALANELEAFGEADIEFHNTLCLLSGHKRLADAWRQYRAIMMALLRQTIFVKDHDLPASHAKHMVLYKLIEDGLEEEASAELVTHLEGSRQRMVRLWEQSERGKAATA
jgi:DNA-binding GntR family transcriptional regulator